MGRALGAVEKRWTKMGHATSKRIPVGGVKDSPQLDTIGHNVVEGALLYIEFGLSRHERNEAFLNKLATY